MAAGPLIARRCDTAAVDELLEIGLVDADVAADLHVGNSALEDQPAPHVGRGDVESFGCLIDREKP